MKAWILGVALVGATGGGVALVLANQGGSAPCGACVEAKANAGSPADPQQPADCPTCKPTRMAATDLADVSALLATADAAGPRVSFEEPPFAQPIRVRAQQPEVETAPMPRPISTTEEAPMPRPAM